MHIYYELLCIYFQYSPKKIKNCWWHSKYQLVFYKKAELFLKVISQYCYFQYFISSSSFSIVSFCILAIQKGEFWYQFAVSICFAQIPNHTDNFFFVHRFKNSKICSFFFSAVSFFPSFETRSWAGLFTSIFSVLGLQLCSTMMGLSYLFIAELLKLKVLDISIFVLYNTHTHSFSSRLWPQLFILLVVIFKEQRFLNCTTDYMKTTVFSFSDGIKSRSPTELASTTTDPTPQPPLKKIILEFPSLRNLHLSPILTYKFNRNMYIA